jgi:hypothetical protein
VIVDQIPLPFDFFFATGLSEFYCGNATFRLHCGAINYSLTQLFHELFTIDVSSWITGIALINQHEQSGQLGLIFQLILFWLAKGGLFGNSRFHDNLRTNILLGLHGAGSRLGFQHSLV